MNMKRITLNMIHQMKRIFLKKLKKRLKKRLKKNLNRLKISQVKIDQS